MPWPSDPVRDPPTIRVHARMQIDPPRDGKAYRWAQMSIKPAKSRSLVLKKSKVTERFRFNIKGTPIPTISETPVKCLDKVFDSSLKDYGNSTKLWFPRKSLEEESKVIRKREVLMYRDSRDPKVAQVGVVVRTGRKWSARAAVLDVESQLRHKDLVDVVAHGRTDFGLLPTIGHKECKGKKKRRQIQEGCTRKIKQRGWFKATGGMDK